MDDFTFSLLTNEEVIAVNQTSENNHELFRRGDGICWLADVPGLPDRYLAVFNIGDMADEIALRRDQLGMMRRFRVRDLWNKRAWVVLRRCRVCAWVHMPPACFVCRPLQVDE